MTSRNSYLRKKYGITEDEYNDILCAQNGRCAICLCKPRTKSLAVDHDHKTNEIRGLLCSRCNHGLLGHAHDSIEMLKRAIEYLENPPAKGVLEYGNPGTDGSSSKEDIYLYEDGKDVSS